MNRDQAARVCGHFSQACGVPCQLIDPQTYLDRGTVYFSPNGLAYFSSPILLGDETAAALVAGPVLIGDRDHLAELHRQHPNVPAVSPDRVQSLSELLSVAARALSDPRDARSGDPSGATLPAAINPEQVKKSISADVAQAMNPAYPIEKERQLLDLVEAGDKAGAQTVLNAILGAVFFTIGTEQTMIQTRVIELVVLLSRAAIRGGADARLIFGQNFACLNKIHCFRTIDEIAYWLSDILARFTDQVFNQDLVKHTAMISLAKDYIKKNYM
ncbi:MAG: hypothetical protein EOM70_14125, partial [Clostridia bacterium]|nr:hypothetical protein [Clostridia bacterium]